MKWQQLLALVNEAQAAAKNAEGAELEKIELDIAAKKLERQLLVSGFEMLGEVTTIPQADLTKLNADVQALKTSIAENPSGGGWKGLLKGIVKTVTGMIPGVGGIAGGLVDRVLE